MSLLYPIFNLLQDGCNLSSPGFMPKVQLKDRLRLGEVEALQSILSFGRPQGFLGSC